uniref:DRBM domain-containing protein n=1 Tax=Rhizophora mucronata TaxID=61149 RepID=A0A2P2QMU1_RHIMU
MAHRAGFNLPVYTTVRSGPGHAPIFTSAVGLVDKSFTGEPAKTKKQAEKNAAIAAWSALKRMPIWDSLMNKEAEEHDDQVVVVRNLSSLRSKDEWKQSRKRDHNQARRRVFRGHGDISFGTSSASCSTNSSILQHWKLLVILLDSGGDDPTLKKNPFASLFSPSSPRIVSKIRPPTSPGDLSLSNRHIPVQVSFQSEPQRQVLTPNPLVVKHEAKCLNNELDAIKQPI